ncbi:MAG: hypothetical protein IT435_08695 [Phycisphaerales bacterium]|nr:hypothetical protein [Phycisphaerales bacterium]
MRSRDSDAENAGGALSRPVLYPQLYPWLILVASLDIMFTWICLHLGGFEFNPIAARFIAIGGIAGALLLKFTCVIVVVLACEAVGRRCTKVGWRLGAWAVGVNALPVMAAIVQLSLYFLHAA